MGYKPKINFNELNELIINSILADIFYDIEYIPILIEGAAGIGKSALVKNIPNMLKQFTNEEYGFYEMRASTLLASDVLGIPFPSRGKNGEEVLKWLKDESFPREGICEKHGIFFIDEFTSITDEPLLSGLLQLTMEREISGYKLPDGWFIIACGNTAEDGNVYNKVPFPLRNRMRIFHMDFDKSLWLEYLRKNNADPYLIDFIETRHHDREFLTYNSRLEEGSEDELQQNYVCGTPRSWDFINRILKTYDHMTYFNSNSLEKEICSLIGNELGQEFYQYRKTLMENHIKLKDILDGEFKNDVFSIDLPTNIDISLFAELARIAQKILEGYTPILKEDTFNNSRFGSIFEEVENYTKYWLDRSSEELKEDERLTLIKLLLLFEYLNAPIVFISNILIQLPMIISTYVKEYCEKNNNMKLYAQFIKRLMENTDLKHTKNIGKDKAAFKFFLENVGEIKKGYSDEL